MYLWYFLFSVQKLDVPYRNDLWLLNVLLEYISLRSDVLPLVQYASGHPVLQLDDNTDQVLCDRQQTLDSIVHQADHILRKCVSQKIAAFKGRSHFRIISYLSVLFLGNPELPTIARSANAARREALEVIRCNGLPDLAISTSNQQDSNFIAIVEAQFSLKYHKSDSK